MRMLASTAWQLLAACVAVAAVLPAGATAQVRRCMTQDGQALYTDRRCEDLGATERRVSAHSDARHRLPYLGGCARQLQDLLFEVSMAIDGGDANRLAGVYHWPGQSSRSGYAIVSRLEAIVRRPLVDIRALRRGEARPAGTADAGQDVYPPQASRLPPVALRIDQTHADGVTPTHTTFGLRRHMGCWWVVL